MSRSHRVRHGPPSREDVEGFLEGVRHRLERASPEQRSRHGPAVAEARAALSADRLAEAAATLEAIDRDLDAAAGEPELSEFPRGLVSYVARGDRGDPTPEDDDPLANRIRLVSRLIEVRRSGGHPVEPWVRALREAQSAYEAGDRRRARALCDATLAEVESGADRSSAER